VIIPFPNGPFTDKDGQPTMAGRSYLSALSSGIVQLNEVAKDPANPVEGQSVIWQSDGTDSGDDGDILIKITAGGVTKTATLIDFSAI
jgi:hypothetical protein